MNLHYSLLQCLGRAQCIVLVHSHCRLFIPTSQITTWESLNRRFDGHNLFLRTHTLFSHLRDIVDGFSHGKMIIGTFQIWVLHVFFSFFCCCSYWTSYFFWGDASLKLNEERRMTITQRGITTWFWTPSPVLDLPSKVWVVVWRRPGNWRNWKMTRQTSRNTWTYMRYAFIFFYMHTYFFTMIKSWFFTMIERMFAFAFSSPTYFCWEIFSKVARPCNGWNKKSQISSFPHFCASISLAAGWGVFPTWAMKNNLVV